MDFLDFDPQQPQFGPCPNDFELIGSWELRSFTAIALRLFAFIDARLGAVSMTRLADVSQSGQAQG
ncbi:hypothetical protein HNQ68_002862 [Pseudochrobactrum saccharolyticum]|uniref:Uncharacterized protein n=1 Tax=Pseudochrobactrum saccharolyticum TaxID=354352 RepID=A0A7W8ER51_9HYPH|nr:hypothetical protein [Pseudochrobactrum saccharolyticum]